MHKNELKVGIAVIASAILLFLGVRFLQNASFIKDTYEVKTQFSNVSGLTQTSPVEINGIKIGSVKSIKLSSDKKNADVLLEINKDVKLGKNTIASIEGINGVGGIRVEVVADNSLPAIEDGGWINAKSKPEMISEISNQMREISGTAGEATQNANLLLLQLSQMLSRSQGSIDGTLGGANRTMNAANQALTDLSMNANGAITDSRQSISILNQNLKQTLGTLSQLAKNQEAVIASSLRNVDGITRDVGQLTRTQRDSLALAIQNVNRLLENSNRTVRALDTTMENLNLITTKIEKGEGSIGQLMNDQNKLYGRVDSLVSNLNFTMLDLRQNPRKYLKGIIGGINFIKIN